MNAPRPLNLPTPLPDDGCPLPPDEVVVPVRKLGQLTDRQRKVFNFVIAYRDTYGRPPTLRAIGAHMNIRSTNGVNDHLRALERKGWIERDDMQARGIRIVGERASCPRSTHAALAAWRFLMQGQGDAAQAKRALIRLYDADPEFRALVDS